MGWHGLTDGTRRDPVLGVIRADQKTIHMVDDDGTFLTLLTGLELEMCRTEVTAASMLVGCRQLDAPEVSRGLNRARYRRFDNGVSSDHVPPGQPAGSSRRCASRARAHERGAAGMKLFTWTRSWTPRIRAMAC